ncbi:hypothetical protein N431DRAFT_481291 [Stipitochalara longipes BDJ]|nr:hypothetical protein N431DRAFT_481291 [Stipitochalara longipes BDJ]
MRTSRVNNFKTRTGCRTCKRRRVKCDETKPSCIRCLRGNRICEGYGIVIDSRLHAHENPRTPPRQSTSLPNIQPKPTISLNTIPFLNHFESVAFERFRSQTVFEMAGLRSSGFWQDVVLPACYSEPAILHASMALSNASRWVQSANSEQGLTNQKTMRLDTVNEYNKAIQYLKEHIDKHDDHSSLRVILIACVIFIALELSSGRHEEAVMHLSEGIKLIQSFLGSGTSTMQNPTFESSALVLTSNYQSTDGQLVGVFVDLDLQSTYHFGFQKPQLKLRHLKCGGNATPEQISSLVLATSFFDIHEANQTLVILTNKCLQFVGRKLDPEWHTLRNKVPNLQRQALRASLKHWRETYGRFCSKASTAQKFDRSWKQRSALMLIQHAWLSVVVPTSYVEVEETDYDAYLNEFSTIIELASGILPEDMIPSSRFSLEFGLVAPLCWAVLKCRHPQLRRTGLCILRRACREGLWEPKLMSQLGHEYIMLEEEIEDLVTPNQLWGESFSSEEKDWRQLIPLQRRISTATMLFESKEYTTLRMTFQRKVWNSAGEYVGMKEIIRRRPCAV